MNGDTRGQVVQIAAILALAIAVLAFASYQATVVPQETATAEETHDSETKSQLETLQQSVHRTGSTGQDSVVSIQLSPEYRPRFLALNPEPRGGSLRTESLEGGSPPGTCENAVCLENVTAVDIETDDYVDTGETAQLNYSSKRLEYQARYNRYPTAPQRIYEATVLYDRFQNATVVRSGQQLIDGSTIRLTLLRGNLSRTGQQPTAVETRGISAPPQTVEVTNSAAGQNLTLTLRTNLTNATWQSLLEDQMTPSGNVTDVRCSNPDGQPCGMLTIELAPGTYDLRVAGVGVGQDADDTTPSYIVPERGNDTVTVVNGSQEIIPQVRDQYNNPHAGVNVEARALNRTEYDLILNNLNTPGYCSGLSLGPSGSVTPSNRLTAESGTAPFVYTAPSGVNGLDQTQVIVTAIDESGALANLGPCELVQNTPPERRAAFYVNVYDIAGFQTITASDVLTGSDRTQNFTFTPNERLPAGTQVEIDLSDPNGKSGGNPDAIEYKKGTPSVTTAGRVADTVSFSNGQETLVYEPGTDVLAGTQIEIRFDGLEVQSASESGFEAVFTRTDTGRTSRALFDIVPPASVFKRVEADDLLEGETGQNQQFTFELDRNLNSTETVVIDLSNADSAGVDYNRNSASVTTTGPGDANLVNRPGGDLVIEYDPSGSEQSGDVIDITVDTVDSPAGTAGSYDVPFVIEDFAGNPIGSNTSTFEVRAQYFTTVSASDLITTQTQNQQLTFEPAGTLRNGETVRINLTKAQGVDANDNPDPVNYNNAGVTQADSGSAQFVAQNDTHAIVEYTAGSDISAGTQITVELSGVIATSNEVSGIEAVFEWEGGNQNTTTFETRKLGFSSVFAEDIQKNEQNQTFRFTPEGTLKSGETVDINVSDAQNGKVNYCNYDTVDATDGTADFSDCNNKGPAVIRFTAGSDISGEVVITVRGATVNSGATKQYTIQFQRNDTSGTNSTTFQLN